jgi:hypothetical protein
LFTFFYSTICYRAKYFSFSCHWWFSFYNYWWVKRNCKVFYGFERFSNPLLFVKSFLVLLFSWVREIHWLLILVLQHLFSCSWQWYLFCSVKVILVRYFFYCCSYLYCCYNFVKIIVLSIVIYLNLNVCFLFLLDWFQQYCYGVILFIVMLNSAPDALVKHTQKGNKNVKLMLEW